MSEHGSALVPAEAANDLAIASGQARDSGARSTKRAPSHWTGDVTFDVSADFCVHGAPAFALQGIRGPCAAPRYLRDNDDKESCER